MTAVIIPFPKALKKRDMAYQAASEAYQYFDESIKTVESMFIADSQGVIAGMHNAFGGFRPEVKNMFLSFLNKPSFESWINIRDFLIDLRTTSWQLWLKYDRTAPQSYDSYAVDGPFPNPDDFIRYYAQHRAVNLQFMKSKRAEALYVMNQYQ